MKKWLMAPIWLIQVFTQSKSFSKNPVIGNPCLNRLGLHVFRVVASHLIMRLRMLLLSSGVSTEHRRDYHRNGFIMIRDFLPKQQFRLLRNEAFGADGEVRECCQGDTLTHRIMLDHHNTESLPGCHEFFDRPELKRLLRFASGKLSRPVGYIQTIKNHYTAGAPDPQKNLHSDTFHPTMKCWYFLEDVDHKNGPFSYSPGSNRLTWARLKWEYRRSIEISTIGDRYASNGSLRADAQDIIDMKITKPVALAVPANTLVIANTNGFHCRGQASEKSTRTELWAISRNNPFNPLPGFDHPWLTRLQLTALEQWRRYCDRRAEAHNGKSAWHIIEARNTIGGNRTSQAPDTPTEALPTQRHTGDTAIHG